MQAELTPEQEKQIKEKTHEQVVKAVSW